MQLGVLNRDFAADVLLHVGFMGLLIGTFFFTYGAYTEKRVVVTEIDQVVDDMFGTYALLATPADEALLGQLSTVALAPPDMSAADAAAAAANRKLEVKAAVAIGATVLVSSVGAFFVARRFWPLFGQILLIMAAVAGTEFAFLTFVASKFRAVDPDYVKLTVIKALQTV